MARYAVIDDNVVVGVLGASTPPTMNIPPNRVFVDITDLPDVKGGETYDPIVGMFSQPITALETRVANLESALESSGVMITATPKVP